VLRQEMSRTAAPHGLTVTAPTAFKLERAQTFGVDNTVQVPRDDPEATPALLRDGGTVLWYGRARARARIDQPLRDLSARAHDQGRSRR
jgi:hypothetical protein